VTGRRCAVVLTAASIAACAPADPTETPTPFFIRLVCAIERLIERDDMRVREEGVSRCAGASRQLERSREQAREILREAIEPGDPETPAPPQGD
jgi:hypothetical protein